MIIAHRGGDFGPENSMKAFRGAVENKMEGIEFDVWLTSDGVPVVIHGGLDGQLDYPGFESSYVWKESAKTLSKIDIGEGESIPKLEEVLALCQSHKRVLINIELKGPASEDQANQYDFDLAARKVVKLIDKYDVGSQTMISSFRSRIIKSILRESRPPYKRRFIVQSLRNAGRLPDPDDYEVFYGTTGINVMYDYMTEDIVQKAHSDGHYIGVWYAADTNTESEEMWEEVFSADGKGVEFFYSDKPKDAILVRNKIQKKGK